MKITKTNLEGCLLIEPQVYRDGRGLFYESFQKERYSKELGEDLEFVQDNFSTSQRGVLRGLHFQIKKPQGKIVRVSRGKVYDVAVDIRPKSKSFKKWFGIELSASNNLQLWIPPGFAHGFLVLSEEVDFEYKCTDYYDPHDEGSIRWNDPEISIDWPEESNIKLSKKDRTAPYLNELDIRKLF